MPFWLLVTDNKLGKCSQELLCQHWLVTWQLIPQGNGLELFVLAPGFRGFIPWWLASSVQNILQGFSMWQGRVRVRKGLETKFSKIPPKVTYFLQLCLPPKVSGIPQKTAPPAGEQLASVYGKHGPFKL